MQRNNELPIVLWTVSCFDKQREKPFPVYTRQCILDWDALNEHQIAEVLEILARDKPTGPSPKGFDSSVISIQRSPSRPDNRMLAYRKYFIELGDNGLEELGASTRGFVCVNLNREYFEDENGNEITHYEMIQHVSGQQQPIIVGDPDSIVRLGPSDPHNESDWTEESANTIAQFLDVVRRICNSDWYRQPQSLTFEIQRGGDTTKFPEATDSTLLEAVFPNDSETMAVLAYFRQLHAGDRLLTRTCDVFMHTCSDARKNWWIGERKESFNRTVDSHPAPFNVPDTRREIIRMFMYGAGLLHATSNHGDDKKLADLIQSQGRQRAVTIFNHCLYDVLSIATTPAVQVRSTKLDQRPDVVVHHVGSCHPTTTGRTDRRRSRLRVGLGSMAGNSQFRYDHRDHVPRLDKRLFP